MLSASSVAAQTIRTYDYVRPLKGERKLTAKVEFAAGTLRLGPATGKQLYQLALRYDAERFEPVGSYDPGAGAVRLGVNGIGKGGIRVDKKRALPQTADVGLSPAVDLALEVSLGAAEGLLQLGGLRLSELVVESGASRTEIDFAKPNPGACSAARVSAGAGELVISNMGNSGCSEWEVDGGVTKTTLELDGAWPAGARLDLSVAVGGLTLVVPKSLGLQVVLSGFLADFDGPGFAKRGKTYTSAGYERAARKLSVQINSAIGGVKVEWR